MATGTQISAWSGGSRPRTAGGRTPITTKGWPLTRTLRPTTSRVACEPPLPAEVADDDDGGGARTALRRQEGPAGRGPDPEDVEVVARHQLAHHVGGGGLHGEAERRRRNGDEAFQGRPGRPREVDEIRVRDVGGPIAVDANHARGLRHGQGLQPDGVQDAEDGRDRADAQGQGQDGARGEQGAAAQEAASMTHVLGRFLDPARAARGTAVFLGLVQAAQREVRAPGGFGTGQAGPHVLVRPRARGANCSSSSSSRSTSSRRNRARRRNQRSVNMALPTRDPGRPRRRRPASAMTRSPNPAGGGRTRVSS